MSLNFELKICMLAKLKSLVMKLKFVLCVAMCGTMMQSAMAQADENGVQEKESPVVTLLEQHSVDHDGQTLIPKEFSNAEELYNFMSWEVEPSGDFKVGRFSIELDFTRQVELLYKVNGMPSGAYMKTRYGKGCIHTVIPERFNTVESASVSRFFGSKLDYEIYIPVNSLREDFQFYIESIKTPSAYGYTDALPNEWVDPNGCKIN